MDTSKDYYAMLGVDSQASASTIKAAFKRLALQYHPDVYKGADAQELMRNLLQAYQTLSDPEARKAYDSEHGGSGSAGWESPSTPRNGTGRGTGSAAQGHYAFPDLLAEAIEPLSLKLDNRIYQLTPAQAENLRWEGIVRGVMADPVITPAGERYCCQRCQHCWLEVSAQGRTPRPLNCPACHAQDWAEYLLLRCTHCCAVFASQEIHDPLRDQSLYYPYELFPLCPHCRRSQWCPAENGRVNSLRAAAARRSALLWGSLVGVCVLLIALIALVTLRS